MAELFRDVAEAVAAADAAADLVVLVEDVVGVEAELSYGVPTGAGFDARVTLCLFAGAGVKSAR